MSYFQRKLFWLFKIFLSAIIFCQNLVHGQTIQPRPPASTVAGIITLSVPVDQTNDIHHPIHSGVYLEPGREAIVTATGQAQFIDRGVVTGIWSTREPVPPNLRIVGYGALSPIYSDDNIYCIIQSNPAGVSSVIRYGHLMACDKMDCPFRVTSSSNPCSRWYQSLERSPELQILGSVHAWIGQERRGSDMQRLTASIVISNSSNERGEILFSVANNFGEIHSTGTYTIQINPR